MTPAVSVFKKLVHERLRDLVRPPPKPHDLESALLLGYQGTFGPLPDELAHRLAKTHPVSGPSSEIIPHPATEVKVAEMIRRIAEGFQPDKIIVFGSRARGTAGSDSDVEGDRDCRNTTIHD